MKIAFRDRLILIRILLRANDVYQTQHSPGRLPFRTRRGKVRNSREYQIRPIRSFYLWIILKVKHRYKTLDHKILFKYNQNNDLNSVYKALKN